MTRIWMLFAALTALVLLTDGCEQPMPMAEKPSRNTDEATALAGIDSGAAEELRSAFAQFKNFRPTRISQVPGETRLSIESSLCIDDIAMTGTAGSAPSTDRIHPFSLNELNALLVSPETPNDHARNDLLERGFNLLLPVGAPATSIDDATVQRQKMEGFNWPAWFAKQGIPAGRYDLLTTLDMPSDLVAMGAFKSVPGFTIMAVSVGQQDPLAPEKLREQEWYPKEGSAEKRKAFEARYYEGFSRMVVSMAEAARRQGWEKVALWCGWSSLVDPWRMQWLTADTAGMPMPGWAWEAYGNRILNRYDFFEHEIYYHYYGEMTLALAKADGMRLLVNALPEEQRPALLQVLRPVSTGGGGGWRWWRNQPLPCEDVRAMTALAYFSGSGIGLSLPALWGNQDAPPPLSPIAEDLDAQFKEPFSLGPISPPDAAEQLFRRYDVAHVVAVHPDGAVHFQKVTPGAYNHGVGAIFPVFQLPMDEFDQRRRAPNDLVPAMAEALALVKPFERFLRIAEPKIDVSTQIQNVEGLPIVRRVKLGPFHLLAVYDQKAQARDRRRDAILRDFDEHPGVTVRVPSDSNVRIYLLQEQ